MPSFDIVSEIDKHELNNAVENANRELSTRFDFRGVDACFESRDQGVELRAEADIQLQQMVDILRNKMIKRDLDPETMDIGSAVHSGKTFSQFITLKEGIDAAMAKRLVKLVKEGKLKVQTAIQGEQLRVTGKKRDDLQQVINLIKASDLGQPFQFTNFRD
ncbi:MAG: YajQ family cyclic di-GMP-binding protein [Cellvibrionaceae bacterium]|nr:YajQ family cyclic di-GMP-binding protein [Cellvibrionaceae bacterium]